MLQSYKVTVVMPCFNGARYLREAIDSVLAQTMADLMLIVVDDGSSDNSVNIVNAYAQADRRVHSVTQRNAGPSSARNNGISHSSSDFVAFIDSDDLWRADHLERHTAELIADSLIGISFSPSNYIDERGKRTTGRSQLSKNDLGLKELLSGNPTTTCSTLVARRLAIQEVGAFRRDMKYAEDQEWLFRIVHSGWTVRSIRERTVYYRTGTSSLSAQTDSMRAGWQMFISQARQLAPEVVDEHLPGAEARMGLYWARQAIANGHSVKIARGHLRPALRAVPKLLRTNPLAAMTLCAAYIAPKATTASIACLRSYQRD